MYLWHVYLSLKTTVGNGFCDVANVCIEERNGKLLFLAMKVDSIREAHMVLLVFADA